VWISLICHRGNANLREQAVNALLQACGMWAEQATNRSAIGEEDQGAAGRASGGREIDQLFVHQ